MDYKKLTESRMQAMVAERARLTEAWQPNIAAVRKYMAKKGRELSRVDEMNIARCLENAVIEAGAKGSSKLFETTDSSSVSFLGIQLPVISALLPSANLMAA